MSATIHDRARSLCRSARVAVTGQNGSATTFALAVSLVHGFGLDEVSALGIMWDEWNPRCLPPWNEADLARKVREAARKGTPPAGKTWGWLLDGAPAPDHGRGREIPAVKAGARICFNPAMLRRMYRNEYGRKCWWTERSPVRYPAEVTPTRYLDAVFRPGDRVLVATSKKSQGEYLYWVGKGWFQLGTAPGQQAVPCEPVTGGPDGVWFLSNPVTGKWRCRRCGVMPPVLATGFERGRLCPNHGTDDWHLAKRNDWVLSRRSEGNVTDFRHLVLEHDPPEHADMVDHARLWASLVAQLPLPVVSFAGSGGKSWHALIRLEARSKGEWDTLREVVIRHLVPYGADPAAIRAVQLTRLPNCLRGSKPQELIYLDPSPEPGGVPVCAMRGD